MDSTSTSLDRTIAEPRGNYLLTRGGARLRLRAVAVTDGPLLAAFFAELSPEDLRFRFLDTRKSLTAKDLAEMLEVDHRRNEHILAFDTATGQLVATLMLAADARMEGAEVAIAVATARKGQGIGWALLQHALDLAFIRGLRKLRSVENRANRAALKVERALGFQARPVKGEPELLVVEAELA
jgi:acetyltransferase